MPLPLKRALAAAAIALALIAPSFVASPANAAPPPPPGSGSFNLTFEFGNRPPPPPPPKRICMDKQDIVQALRANGYRDGKVVENLGRNRVLAVARKASKWYQLRIDICSGFVDQIKRVRLRGDGSFDFSLNFDDDYLPPEELVCLVTYYDERSAAYEDEDEIQSAELMRRSEAQDLDRPRDRRVIMRFDTDREARNTCEYLNSINN